jgi:alanyl aminopeptidase
VLAFVLPVAGDKSRFVTEAAIQIVSALREQQLAPPELQPKVAALVRASFGKRAHALGLAQKKGEDEDATILRPSLVSFVGDVGQDPQLVAEARRLTEAWLHDRTAIGAEMVPTTLALAAANGDRPLFDKLRAAARAEPSRPDRQRILGALGAFRDPALAAEALKLTLSDELDPRETIGILFSRSYEPETRQLAWDFLRSNFDALAARLPRDSAAGFPPIGAAFCDEEHRPEVEAFFKDRAPKYVGGPRRLAQALESMKLCSAARTRLAPGVAAFLEHR